MQRRKIDVLIIDPLKRIHAVDENDNTAMDLVTQQLTRIADECDAGVVVVHHTRKGRRARNYRRKLARRQGRG